ncbi:hypothetical protein QNO07_10520 [Streptomyces sp. 549]|uniref:SCO4225 family membrane protein n=1 Tax=Streptomyces sp. 549 TaxID=3049076 RepID=UPI0024C2766B|nr:hypothetical protein [Streptomyces sp. 549]MDK1473849.1 hypothetical protein [Streptomyces sp. 549]
MLDRASRSSVESVNLSNPKELAMPHASTPRRLPRTRRLLVLATDNWLARGYLALVVASFFFPASVFFPNPLMLTAPLSFLVLFLPFGPGTASSMAVGVLALGLWTVWLLLCALANAAVLGALVKRVPASPSLRESLPQLSVPSTRQVSEEALTAHSRLRRARTLLAPAVDNWLARGYLVVVAGALGLYLGTMYLMPDPGYTAAWTILATAPFGLLAFLVSIPAEYSSLIWLHPLVFIVGAVLSGLFNAVLLGRLARTLRAPELRPAA